MAILENKYDEVEVYSWWERNVEIGIVIWMSGGRRAPNFGLEQESLNEKKEKKGKSTVKMNWAYEGVMCVSLIEFRKLYTIESTVD